MQPGSNKRLYNHSTNSNTKLAADLNTYTKHNDLSMVKDSGPIQRDREVQGYR